MRTMSVATLVFILTGCGTVAPAPAPAPAPKAAVEPPGDSKSSATSAAEEHPESKDLQALYDNFRKRTQTSLPQSGFEKVAEAIAAAKPEATELLVPVSDEYQVLLSRKSALGQNDWTLCRSVLLLKKPKLEHFSVAYDNAATADQTQLRSLLHYYGSEWIRQHTTSAEVYAADLLWWNTRPYKETDGNVTFETGNAQTAGNGLHITLTPAGELVSVSLAFSDD